MLLPALLPALLILAAFASGAAQAATGAAADPPRSLALDLAAPPAQWLPQVLPAGARLLHGPVSLPFGAHASGRFLAWRTAEGGYALVYLTPDADDPRQQRWLWLREPREADFGMDVEVRAVLAAGPALSRDIVLLETFSRPAPAGGAREDAGSVYRRVGDGVQAVPELTPLLQGVATAAEARARLAPAYESLLPAVPGRLAALFAGLPWPQVELTALERLQRLQPGHPEFKTYDSANGFLEIRGDAGRPGYRAALFRHAEGGWLLAVQKRWPEAQRTGFMLQGVGGTGAWQDVSVSVMPRFNPTLDYMLPQRGTRVTLQPRPEAQPQPQAKTPTQTLHPAPGRSSPPAEWAWNGRRFQPAAPAR